MSGAKGFHMADIYYTNESEPSVWWYISDPTQDLGTLVPFETTPSAPCKGNYCRGSWKTKQISCESKGNCFAKLMKTLILTCFRLFLCQNNPENSAPGGHGLYTPESESTSDIPVTKCHDHAVKLFEKMDKNLICFTYFCPFWVQNFPKLSRSGAKIYSQQKYTRHTCKPSFVFTQ